MPIARDASVIRSALVKLMGGRCVDCGSSRKLEFSHERPTGLSGKSRGSTRRVLDVCRNVDAYKLRCKRCHTIYDGKQPGGRDAPTGCRYHPGTPLSQCQCSELVQ